LDVANDAVGEEGQPQDEADRQPEECFANRNPELIEVFPEGHRRIIEQVVFGASGSVHVDVV
jgi:hypothetical protein